MAPRDGPHRPAAGPAGPRPRTLAALVAIGSLAVLAAAGCGSTSSDVSSGPAPATVERVPGSAHARIHLSATAARRLGIQVATITDAQVPPRPGSAPPATATAAAATAPASAAVVPTPAAAAAPVGHEPVDGAKPAAPATPAIPVTTAAPATTAAPSTALRRVIPFEAVLYQPDGDPFTYANPQPLVYVFQPLSIDYVAGDLAVLDNGPPAGTAIVTVGGTELLGVEFGVGVGL